MYECGEHSKSQDVLTLSSRNPAEDNLAFGSVIHDGKLCVKLNTLFGIHALSTVQHFVNNPPRFDQYI